MLARRSVAHDVLTVTDHLLMAGRAQLSALEDPAGGETLIAGLQTGRQNAGDLRRRSARWQQVLQDGVTDLTADIEYDLRDRLRRIGREAEEAIDETDPGPVWDEFDEWLGQRVRATVAANFVWAHERAQWLAAQVAAQFDATDVALPELVARRRRRGAGARRAARARRGGAGVARRRRSSSRCAAPTAAC